MQNLSFLKQTIHRLHDHYSTFYVCCQNFQKHFKEVPQSTAVVKPIVDNLCNHEHLTPKRKVIKGTEGS